MIKVIDSHCDEPHSREASRMVLPRYGIAEASNGSILKCPARHFAGREVTPIPGGRTRTRTQKGSKGPPLMPEMPETPSAVHPVAETLKTRTEMDVFDVAVLTTRKCAGSRTKSTAEQLVGSVDRRHGLASKLGAAGVVYLSSREGVVSSRPSHAASGKHEKPLSEKWR
jgi:hypothetical protein